jgi:hypothetical protein
LSTKTVQVGRVNTIAVYENGSFSEEYGHYQSEEKMSAVILDVGGSNSVFNNGKNVILIPTSVFTETRLHGLIENSVGRDGEPDTSKLPDYLSGANISGIDRDGYTNEVSKHVECIVTHDVSLEDAMRILEELILTSANESEGQIFEYYASGQPETLGVPSDVLALIPLDTSGIENSPAGEWPRTPFENFVQLVATVIQFAIEVVMLVVNFFVKLFEWLVEFGMNLLVGVAEALPVAEAIFKAVVLAFIWMRFAFTLILYQVQFLSYLALISMIGAIIGGSITLEPNSIILTKEEVNFSYGYYIGTQHFDVLDLDVPALITEYQINDYTYKKAHSYGSQIGINAPELVNNTFSQITALENSTFANSTNTNYSDNNTEVGLKTANSDGDQALNEFVRGIITSWSDIGLIQAIYSLTLIKGYKKYLKYFTIFTISTSLIALSSHYLKQYFIDSESPSPLLWYGLAVGGMLVMIITCIISFVVGETIGGKEGWGINVFKAIIIGSGLLLKIRSLYGSIKSIFEDWFRIDSHSETDQEIFEESIALSILSIMIGGISIGLNDDNREQLQFLLIKSGIAIFFIFAFVGSVIAITENI